MKIPDYIKAIILPVFACLVYMLPSGCSESTLDVNPKGVVTDLDLNSPENVEKMVIAAYAGQANDLPFSPFGDMWEHGAVGGGDAHKGGGGIGDQIGAHWIEVKSLNRSTGNPRNDLMWKYLYASIGRANDALARLNNLTDAKMPVRSQRIAEMRFLRAQSHFKLKVIYKHIVYLDETIPKEEYIEHHNRELSDQDGWAWIINEWRAAIAGLPATQADEGRPTSSAARLFLAKSLIFKASVLGDNHQLTGLTASELNEAIGIFEAIDGSGEYDLHDDYAKNFLCDEESGIESVWAIMRSIDDGSPDGRLAYSTVLNSPVSAGYGCCGFLQPSVNLANAYETDANGLPLFNTFNDDPIVNSNVDVESRNMDPRIAHTIGLLGMPFKYNPALIVDSSFPRVSAVYGTNMGMKDQELPDHPCWRQLAAFYGSARNTDQMRYGDALLYWAEALVGVGRQVEALPIINRIRTRAGSPASLSRLVKADGSPSGKYVIGLYQASDFTDQAKAMEIVQWERRLEMALESHPGRHFDLWRWGIGATWMNAYFEVEKTRRTHMIEGLYTAGRDEFHPIPDIEVTISRGLIQQNPGF